MKKNETTITVGIPAYNEEKNIKNLLRSVIMQEEKGFIIQKIKVISDGSTDQTVKRAKEIKDNRLEITSYKKRIGKSSHLNTLFKNLDTDILVLFDADVTLADKFTIQKLIQPLIKDKKVALVGGSPEQYSAKTFLEKATQVGLDTYREMRLNYKEGHNVYCCIGQILALAKPFAKQTVVAKDVMSNDSFLYFACLTKGFKFRHVEKAKVLYRAPKKLSDHLKQDQRFTIAKIRLIKIFGNFAKKEYKIPKKI